jgi:ABC-2 type transport system ATP-binding protein
MEYAIETENLTKKFGDFIAVDNLDLTIKKGEIFGLLGPNGAGKTTTIKMLATLLKPTSGFAEVWHHNILREQDAVRKSIGIVFQDLSVDTELTGSSLFCMGALRISYRLGMNCRKSSYILCYNVTINEKG